MKIIILIVFISLILFGCGKVGPLVLSEDKIDKSVISYPCDDKCMKAFEAEKARQKQVIIQTD